jgi:hypothetical protein
MEPPPAPLARESGIALSMDDVSPRSAAAVGAIALGAAESGGESAAGMAPRPALGLDLSPDAPASAAGALAMSPGPATTTAPPEAPTTGQTCAHHRSVESVAHCEECNAPLCRTCQLEFQGGVVLCPNCAVAPGRATGPRGRVTLLVVCGVLSVFSLAVWLITIAVAAGMKDQSELGWAVLGQLAAIVGLGPALIALGCSIAPFERHHANPLWLWAGPLTAAVANAVWILTLLIGATTEVEQAEPPGWLLDESGWEEAEVSEEPWTWEDAREGRTGG